MSKLEHYIKVTSVIETLTGLHIGGNKDELKIGGIDSPVIRNPRTNRPYIPGSSLKGRFRMALELKYNDIANENGKGGPSNNEGNNSKVAVLFGSGSANKCTQPTRFIFRDCDLLPESDEYIEGEEKNEVKIDRNKMAAAQGGNRIQERISAGAKFGFEMMMRIFENDDEELFKNRFEEAAKIVELEYLGGSGTRGYGKVKFDKFTYEKIEI